MSDSKEFNEMNEQELQQAAGGWEPIVFRCPVCKREITAAMTGCAVGQEGPRCPNCFDQTKQIVRMIRIS